MPKGKNKKLRTNLHVLEALRIFAKEPCRRSNCGTCCQCGSCHARSALPDIEKREERHQARLKRLRASR